MSDSKCIECAVRILPGEVSFEHTQRMTLRSVIICSACECDWTMLSAIEKTVPSYGKLREKILTASVQGMLREPFQLNRVNRWIDPAVPKLSSRSVSSSYRKRRVSVPKKPGTFAERTVSIATIAFLAPAPVKQMELDFELKLPLPEPVLQDLSKLTNRELFLQLERDILESPKHYLIVFERSLARKEICKRRSLALLTDIIDYLETNVPAEGSYLQSAWGRLFYRLQCSMDPANQSTPEMFDDLDGWVAWSQSVLEKFVKVAA